MERQLHLWLMLTLNPVGLFSIRFDEYYDYDGSPINNDPCFQIGSIVSMYFITQNVVFLDIKLQVNIGNLLFMFKFKIFSKTVISWLYVMAILAVICQMIQQICEDVSILGHIPNILEFAQTQTIFCTLHLLKNVVLLPSALLMDLI